jgi:hypothetical protein
VVPALDQGQATLEQLVGALSVVVVRLIALDHVPMFARIA